MANIDDARRLAFKGMTADDFEGIELTEVVGGPLDGVLFGMVSVGSWEGPVPCFWAGDMYSYMDISEKPEVPYLTPTDVVVMAQEHATPGAYRLAKKGVRAFKEITKGGFIEPSQFERKLFTELISGE